jgi:hypothetical protein
MHIEESDMVCVFIHDLCRYRSGCNLTENAFGGVHAPYSKAGVVAGNGAGYKLAARNEGLDVLPVWQISNPASEYIISLTGVHLFVNAIERRLLRRIGV